MQHRDSRDEETAERSRKRAVVMMEECRQQIRQAEHSHAEAHVVGKFQHLQPAFAEIGVGGLLLLSSSLPGGLCRFMLQPELSSPHGQV